MEENIIGTGKVESVCSAYFGRETPPPEGRGTGPSPIQTRQDNKDGRPGCSNVAVRRRGNAPSQGFARFLRFGSFPTQRSCYKNEPPWLGQFNLAPNRNETGVNKPSRSTLSPSQAAASGRERG